MGGEIASMSRGGFRIERSRYRTGPSVRTTHGDGSRYGFILLSATICLWVLTPSAFARDAWTSLIAAANSSLSAFLSCYPARRRRPSHLRAQEGAPNRTLVEARAPGIAFGDIASIGFYQPDATEPAMLAVIRLKRSDHIPIVSDGSVLEEKTMNFIAAVTGLPRIDTVYRT